MKKTSETIKESIKLHTDINHENQLNEIYNKIPSGSCNGCGDCCAESVHLFYSEFLSIYQYLLKEDKLEKTLKDVKEFHLNEWTKAQKCIFLDENNACSIYPVRPLVCRLFGHKSKYQHNKDYKTIKKRNKAVDQAVFIEYGVHINKEVLKHKIKFCKVFNSERVLSPEDHKFLMDDMYGLEMIYLTEELITDQDFEKSLTQWFVDFFLPELRDPKVKVDGILLKNS